MRSDATGQLHRNALLHWTKLSLLASVMSGGGERATQG
jgi:hypothetical protein